MNSSFLAKSVATAVILGGSGAALYFLLKRSKIQVSLKEDKEQKMTKELLELVLRDLLRSFHGVLVEMASMVQRLEQLGALKGPQGAMSSDQIAGFLMQQGIQAKLDAAQTKVLLHHNVSPTEVETAQERYSEDPKILMFVHGFNSMFEEASLGLTPVLPGSEIPSELTEDKAIDIMAQIHQERLKAFKEALDKFWKSDESGKVATMDPSQGPPPALAQALQLAHDQAEIVVLNSHSHIISDKAVFDSAMAVFSRRDGAFLKEKLRMERSHQVEIVNLMRNKNLSDAPKLEAIDGLHPKLLCSNEGDMAHQILEAAEKKKPVVTALVRNMEDPRASLMPLSLAIDSGKLQTLVEKDCTFLYMPAHEDIPLANRPEYKNVDVCYIFFPRPDKQQRPVACFTLQELIEASSVDLSIYEGPGSVVFAENINTLD